MVKDNGKAAPQRRTVAIWAIQCNKCFKWRTIGSQEEFEELRSKSGEDPFVCSRKPNVSCDDPADIEYNSTRVWVADRPNIPKTPVGFKRSVVMRNNFSKMDIYYTTPTGKSLRSSTQAASFLQENPQFKDLSIEDFSFNAPKVMEDTVPENVRKKAIDGF